MRIQAASLFLALFTAGCGIRLPGDIGGSADKVAQESPLHLIAQRVLSDRLIELTLSTPAMGGETLVRVLLPKGYEASASSRYPVLYLYNGSFDDEKAWTEKGDAENLTADYPLIIVMPDGGAGGFYSDWYNYGAFGPPAFETFHMDQLIPWIDANFRTVAAREGRATMGLSMGGFGAFAYAARHPDLFVSASSFSGVLNTNQPPVINQPDESLLDGGLLFDVWGPRATQEVRWRGHNPWDLAENLRGLDLTLRTGDGRPQEGFNSIDPIEIVVHLESTDMHNKLDELGIAHLWDDYRVGGHSWDYWQRGLTQTLPIVMDVFAHPPAPPSPFTFSAIESAYSVYGWQVQLQRAQLEFSSLRNAGPQGFTLSGSGHGAVTTAGHFDPGTAYVVTHNGDAGAKTETLKADDAGRLQVNVTLGPPNAYQQYTPQALLAGTRVYRVEVSIAR